jgi:hypothetical protein
LDGYSKKTKKTGFLHFARARFFDERFNGINACLLEKLELLWIRKVVNENVK